MSGHRSDEAVIVGNLLQVQRIDPELANFAVWLCTQLGHSGDYTPVGSQERDAQARVLGEFAVPLTSEADPPKLGKTDREASYAGQ